MTILALNDGLDFDKQFKEFKEILPLKVGSRLIGIADDIWIQFYETNRVQEHAFVGSNGTFGMLATPEQGGK